MPSTQLIGVLSGLAGLAPHILLGLFVTVFMAAFDITVGRFVLRFQWSRIWRDFNPASGNYLSIGLLLGKFAIGLIFGFFLGVVIDSEKRKASAARQAHGAGDDGEN